MQRRSSSLRASSPPVNPSHITSTTTTTKIKRSSGRFSLPPETLYGDDNDSDSENNNSSNNNQASPYIRESTPSFSLHAPHSSSNAYDSDTSSNDDDDEVESRYRRYRTLRSPSPSYHRPNNKSVAVEIAIAEQTTRLEQQLRLKAHKRLSDLQSALLHIDAEERKIAQEAAIKYEKERRDMVLSEAELAAKQAQERGQMLNTLRIKHEQTAAVAAQQLAAKEEAARKKAEIEKQKALMLLEKQKAAEQAKAAQEKEEEQKRLALIAEQQKQQEEQAAAAAAKATTTTTTTTNNNNNVHGILNIAPSAQEFQQRCASTLATAQSTVQPFIEDRSMRDVKRSIDKFITLNVQQISATLDQVRAKSQALIDFISRHHQPQKTYALITLAGKLLSQCEVQITRLHSFAFPLAEVATAVASAHHEFVDILLARLHAACPLSVPLYYGFRSTQQGADEIEYLKLMGYKIEHDDDDGSIKKESTDDFVGRTAGYVMLYAAMTQSDNPANPHNIQHAWEYVARLLNALPANRLTASALDAFLKVAGYKMAMTYRGQFIKLLKYVDGTFLIDLKTQSDPDARAVATRLSTYLRMQRYLQPPEGRSMPQHDASSYDRA